MVAIAALTEAMGAMAKIKPKQWKGMKSGLAGVKKAAGSMMSMGKALGIVQEILKPFIKLFEFFGKMIKTALAPIMQKLFEVLFSPAVMDLMKVMADMLLVFIIPALDMLVLILNLIVDSGFLEILTNGIQMFANVIKLVWENVLSWIFNAFIVAFQFLGKMFTNIWNNVLKPIWDLIINAFEFLGKVFKNIWENFLKPVWNAMITVFEFFVNFWINIINFFIGVINAVTLGAAGLKNIPSLDTGGTVAKTGLAIIHKGEDIIPAAEAKDRRKGTGKVKGDIIVNIANVRDRRDIGLITEAIWQVS